MKSKTFKSFDEVDKEKFKQLIKSGFGKTLVDWYFNYVNPKYIHIIENGLEYIGAIVIEDAALGFDYLDKIVVASSYKGNGYGNQLWDKLIGNSKKLLWRANKANPFNKFYNKHCTGMQKVGKWNIYWVGLTPSQLKDGIKYALSKKETLE